MKKKYQFSSSMNSNFTTFKESVKVFSTFILFFLFVSKSILAQGTININDEKLNLQNMRSIAPEELINDYLGTSEQAREFNFNPQLKSLSKENEGDSLLLDFFEGKQYKSIINNVSYYNNGTIGITAKITGKDFDFCYISVSDSDIAIYSDLFDTQESFITSKKGSKTYICRYKTSVLREKELPSEEVHPEISESSALLTINKQAFSPEKIIAAGKETLPGAMSACGAAELTSSVNIDVLIPYTPEAKKWADNNSGGIDHVITLAMQTANQAMVNSQTGISFNLAHSYETNYDEGNNKSNSKVILDHLQKATDATMDDIHAMRKEYHADLVMLFAYISDAGGRGYLLTNEKGSPNYAFAISRVQQAARTFTTVHEMAHNMGCSHHKLQNGSSGLYSYSYGWRGTNATIGNFATIMTYPNFDNAGDFPRINYFSDPDIILHGVALGDAVSGNNALTLRRSKRLISLYSDVINTSISDIELSTGRLSPAFDADTTEYEVILPYNENQISIVGIPNYDCAIVSGNQSEKALNVGENNFEISARSHDSSVSTKKYKIKVIREAKVCRFYESIAPFGNDIATQAGSEELNLNLSPAAPLTNYGNTLTLDMPKKGSHIYLRENNTSNICHYNGNKSVNLGTATIKVTKKGNYTFDASRALILTIFDAETPSCESFINSSAYWSGEGTSYYPRNSLTLTLEANTSYYIRATENSSKPQNPLDISITNKESGIHYTESEIPNGTAYTYIAVDQINDAIVSLSSTGDFRNLSRGEYRVYGFSYSADSNIENYTTLTEVQASTCEMLSKNSLKITIEDYATAVTQTKTVVLKAEIHNGELQVSGLSKGKAWTVYDALGSIIYSDIAKSRDEIINLPLRGIYFVSCGDEVIKVAYQK